MTNEKIISEEELMRKIIIERFKAMPPNVKIALGSQGKFFGKEDILRELNENTDIGKKLVKIQFEYLKSFKEGVFF